MPNTWTKTILSALILLVTFASGAAASWYFVSGHTAVASPRLNETPQKPQSKARPAVGLRYTDDLKACYEAMLAREPAVQEGTVHLHLTIKENGQIDHLKMIQSQLGDGEFDDCVLENVRAQIITPTPERLGVVISHKFNFRKKETGNVSFE